jgi:uncharacterized protein YjbI with pentapeptide repeats
MLHTSPRREERRVYQQQQPRWWKRILWLGGILVALVVVLVLIRIGYAPSLTSFTGFGQHEVKQDVQPAKTLWDWLDLLIVPVVLAIGGYLFTRSENRSTQAAAERRALDDTLQAYLEGMSQLLTDKERPLRRAQQGDNLSSVARARTLTVLPRLDGNRKRSVLQFLYESGLITGSRPVLDLNGADLNGANLRMIKIGGMEIVDRNGDGIEVTDIPIRVPDSDHKKAVFRGARLRNTHLSNACLLWANLQGTDLSGADLLGADLRGAYLQGADLTHASLIKADLRGARLQGAKLNMNIAGANLKGAKGKFGETLPNETLADAVRESEVWTGRGESIPPKGGSHIHQSWIPLGTI